MENDKNYYQGIIKVIDRLLTNDKFLSSKEGESMTGVYWSAIVDVFRNTRRGAYIMTGDNIGKKDGKVLLALKEECLNRIKSIEDAEYDRSLSIKESQANIRYGKRGFVIALIALGVSILALVLEIIKWLQD